MTDTTDATPDADAAVFNDRINTTAAFVQARCDEDEATAHGCPSRDWVPDGATVRGGPRVNTAGPGPFMSHAFGRPIPDTVAVPLPREPRPDDFWTQVNLHGTTGKFESETRVAEHIARHDPARVLAETRAKRARAAALLAYARKAEQVRAEPDRFGDGNRGEILGMLMAYMHAVSADAGIWAEHPSYDPSWRVGP